MILFLVSILAGILTVLAPCILPILPIVIGSSDGRSRGISKRAVVVISSLAVSVIVVTLVLKASTLLIAIPTSFWTWLSGGTITVIGVLMIFPALWNKLSFVGAVGRASNQAVASGYQKQSNLGDVIVGAALGPVFTTCSPTYFFILASILPAGFVTGFIYLLGFTAGMSLSLLLIAYFGQKIISKITTGTVTVDLVKKAFGVLFVIVGLAIISGYDKKFETYILDSGYGATIKFEERLIERFGG